MFGLNRKQRGKLCPKGWRRHCPGGAVSEALQAGGQELTAVRQRDTGARGTELWAPPAAGLTWDPRPPRPHGRLSPGTWVGARQGAEQSGALAVAVVNLHHVVESRVEEGELSKHHCRGDTERGAQCGSLRSVGARREAGGPQAGERDTSEEVPGASSLLSLSLADEHTGGHQAQGRRELGRAGWHSPEWVQMTLRTAPSGQAVAVAVN